MASKYGRQITITSLYNENEGKFPTLKRTQSLYDDIQCKNIGRNNFIITIDNVPGDPTTGSNYTKENVADGWKMSELQRSKSRIIPDTEITNSDALFPRRCRSNLPGFNLNSNTTLRDISSNNKTRISESCTELRVSDRRRVSRFLENKKQTGLSSTFIQDERKTPFVTDSSTKQDKQSLRFSAIQRTIHLDDFVRDRNIRNPRMTPVDAEKYSVQLIEAPRRKCLPVESYPDVKHVSRSPQLTSIDGHSKSNNFTSERKILLQYESENNDFHSRNQFMTSSLREHMPNGRRVRRVTSRRELRHSMSELGFGKLQSYRKLELIGEGTYATVYKGYSMLLEKMVALKEIRMEKTEGAPCTAIREISLLRYLRHANIVTLHDVIFTESSLTLVFEYINQDLRSYMDSLNNRLPMETVRIFMFQIFRALEFCHARRILHRDLKPQNLLITKNKELKLADFGLARSKSIPTKTYSNEVATLWYRPPDVLLGDRNYSGHIDIWGAGCIFYEMATGRTPFPGDSKDSQIQVIFRKLGIPPDSYWPGLRENDKFQQLVLQQLSNQSSNFTVTRTASSLNNLKTDFENDEQEAYTDHLREILTERVKRLNMPGITLLTKCLQLVGSKRITAENALNDIYFEGILPKGITVKMLSPEASIILTPKELTTKDQSCSILGKNSTKYAHRTSFTASMNDLQATQPMLKPSTRSKTFTAFRPIKRPLLGNSQNIFSNPAENGHLLNAQNNRFDNLYSSCSNINELCELDRIQREIDNHTSTIVISQSNQLSISKDSERRVKFKVVGYHATSQENDSDLLRKSKNYLKHYKKTCSNEETKIFSIPDSQPISLMNSIKANESLRTAPQLNLHQGNSMQSTATQSSNNAVPKIRIIRDTPAISRSINLKAPSSPTYLNFTSTKSNMAKPPNNLSNDLSLNRNGIYADLSPTRSLDFQQSPGYLTSNSPIPTVNTIPIKSNKFRSVGVSETKRPTRGPIKVYPLKLNRNTPAYMHIKGSNSFSSADGKDTPYVRQISDDDGFQRPAS